MWEIDGNIEDKTVGLEDGITEERKVGEIDGILEATTVGSAEGIIEGGEEDNTLGNDDGFSDCEIVGAMDGVMLAIIEGDELESSEGEVDGTREGSILGPKDASREGPDDERIDGSEEGTYDGDKLGKGEGKVSVVIKIALSVAAHKRKKDCFWTDSPESLLRGIYCSDPSSQHTCRVLSQNLKITQAYWLNTACNGNDLWLVEGGIAPPVHWETAILNSERSTLLFESESDELRLSMHKVRSSSSRKGPTLMMFWALARYNPWDSKP